MLKLPNEIVDRILLWLDDPELAIRLKRGNAIKMICKKRDNELLSIVGIDIPNFQSLESVVYFQAIFL
jgi:hypothetical protein